MLPEWLSFWLIADSSSIIGMFAALYAAWGVLKLRSELRDRDRKHD